MKPFPLIELNRNIQGASAVFLPFLGDGKINWSGWEQHLVRTIESGLIPAVNMDTGYVNRLSPSQRAELLDRAQEIVGNGPLFAGAFVADRRSDSFDFAAYRQALEMIQAVGATPVIFQSYGLVEGEDQQIFDRYAALAEISQRFIAFELGTMFAPFGKIYSTELFSKLIELPQCVGLKHSSLSRRKEWRRLEIRNQVRPDFRLYTGNDLAIDMVMYGSDYLLGISTFHPAAFAARDRFWRTGHSGFYALNDALQALGWFAFRDPVPAYKHSAAIALKLNGWIENDSVPWGETRPGSDREVLRFLLNAIESAMAGGD